MAGDARGSHELEDLLSQLDELIGLDEVKHQVHQVTHLLKVQRLRAARCMAIPHTSQRLVFAGNPGTGKTTVARLLGHIYCQLGVVSKRHLVEVDRAGLVAGFVGQTAGRVDEVVEEALGGVLLIDEAYGLVRGGVDDYGREALDALVKPMEDHRDDLVVIVAGYPDEMDDFLDANPGLRSRFPRVIQFPDYSDQDLLTIFQLLCRGGDYVADSSAIEAAHRHIQRISRGRGFGNGRLSRTMFEQAITAHATRLARHPDPTDDDLSRLISADLGVAGKAGFSSETSSPTGERQGHQARPTITTS
ncbi:MAG: SpoVK/Ycf46/Vps4 family AAA+-type ATPase [Candidatus Poriferisodalaceae bacterium]